MKRHPSRTHRSAIILPFGRVLLGWLLVTFWLFTPQLVFGTDKHWTGTTNATWGTATNWFEGSPPGGTGDNAVFDRTFNNQPTLGATTTAGGLWMTGNVGQNVTISGSTLTLQGNTINGTAGLGILIDNANAFTLTINAPLKLGGAQTWLNNSSNLFTVSGAVNNNGVALTIDGSGNTAISGVVSKAGSLIKAGTGTLTLSGANTYTGGTNIDGGTLQVAATETAGTSGPLGKSGTISFGGGTLQYSASNTFDYSSRFSTATNQAYRIDTNSQNVTFASALTSSGGSLTKLGSGTLTLSGANTYSGATTISSGTLSLGNGGTTGSLSTSSAITDNANLTINRSNAVVQGTDFSGNAITGTGSFTQAGSGTTTLNAANTYSGGTTVSAGTLQLSGSGTLGSTSGTLTVNGGTLNLNGTNQGVGNLTGSGGTIVSNAAGTVTLTIGNSNGTGGNYSGVIANGTGTVALTKTGSGTITLSGANTYTGATSVSGGTLLVNGSLASGSAVSVTNSGTVLGGTGTIGGAVTVGSGANLLGGTGSAASGTLTLANNLTLNSGSIIELALGASGAHSTLARTGTGTWTFDATQAFTFINLGAQPGTYSNIITGLGSDPGESGWTITDTGWIGTFSYTGGNISLNVIAVPEPATYLTGLLTLVALGYHQGRRWRCLLRGRVTSHL
jgi:autotransporter-associated beta strand protein